MVFFADAFGLREWYNRPGTVDAQNWTLRLPPDHVARYAERLGRDEALNLPAALALALRARGGGADAQDLARRLDAAADGWRAGDFAR
jgi:hypothetical protein